VSQPVTILAGDCLTVLPTLADESFDAVVTDPPYALESAVGRQLLDVLERAA
jgi:DNA modification methylase